MRRTEIVSSVIVLSVLYAACKHQTDTVWRQDCGAFVQTLTDLASKASGSNTNDWGDQFKNNKEVIWNLNFKEIKQNAKEGESLLFDLEPFGIPIQVLFWQTSPDGIQTYGWDFGAMENNHARISSEGFSRCGKRLLRQYDSRRQS